MRTEWECFPIK